MELFTTMNPEPESRLMSIGSIKKTSQIQWACVSLEKGDVFWMAKHIIILITFSQGAVS